MCTILLGCILLKKTMLTHFYQLYIVGFFDKENSIEQQTFELSIQKVNIDPKFANVYLKAEIKIIDSTDTYMTGLKGKYMKIFGNSRILILDFSLLLINEYLWCIIIYLFIYIYLY